MDIIVEPFLEIVLKKLIIGDFREEISIVIEFFVRYGRISEITEEVS
jgi:hypothetical protein